MRKSITNKLSNWNIPNTKFVILHDQDSADCKALKAELQALCDKSRKNALVRIACKELEAWYFGDLKAVGKAYEIEKISGLSAKRKYKEPDKIGRPNDELKKFIPHHQQISGAKLIAPHMDVDSNTSTSFNQFINGVRRLFT